MLRQLFLVAALCGTTLLQTSNAAPSIIPPIKWEAPPTAVEFRIGSTTQIIAGHDDAKPLAEMLAKDMSNLNGLKDAMAVVKADDPAVVKSIILSIDSTVAISDEGSDEGYVLNIDNDIEIKAKTKSGLAFGSRTLLQIIKNGNVLPKGSTTDQPEHGLRFFSLDCARHYYSMDFLRDLVRRLSWYKMNGLILHCVDAEAFRFDMEEFPGLAPEGYLYTKADVTELIELGETLGVDIIPGFEFPGHNSALNIYFGTSLGEDCAKQFYEWVTPDWLMDISNPESMEVTKKILTAAKSWFKSKYVHLGADELPPKIGTCEKIKKFMDEKNIKSWGDMAIKWTNELVEWVKDQGQQAIIFNGLEHMDFKDEVVSKDAIIQFWTAPGLEYWQKHGHRLIMSEPADKVFYLTPNAYHYIFPNHKFAYEEWTPKEGASKSSSTLSLKFDNVSAIKVDEVEDKSITLGYAFNVWGDYINWLEDAYVEKHASYPAAIIAAKSWNVKTVDMIGRLETDFRTVYNHVGAPPSLIGQPQSVRDGFKELHHYSFNEEKINPSIIAACSAPNCLFVEDRQGTRHASTYISTSTGNFFSEGKSGFGKCLEFDRVWGKEGLGMAGLDISPPWTYAAWINMKESEVGAPLMFSRDAALKLEQKDTSRLGVSIYGESTTHHSFDASIPIDQEWHHVTFTNDGTMTRVYIDGEIQGSPLPIVFDLPMISIGGYDPPRGEANHQAPIMKIDEVRIFEGSADPDQVKWIKDMSPDVNPNEDEGGDDSGAHHHSSSVFLMTTLFAIIFSMFL